MSDTLTLTLDDNGKAINPPGGAFSELLGAMRDNDIRRSDLSIAETALLLAETEEVEIRGEQVVPGTGLAGIVDVPKGKNVIGATLLWNGRVFRREDTLARPSRSVYVEVLPVVTSSTQGARPVQ